jgi:hypothetical protein
MRTPFHENELLLGRPAWMPRTPDSVLRPAEDGDATKGMQPERPRDCVSDKSGASNMSDHRC